MVRVRVRDSCVKTCAAGGKSRPQSPRPVSGGC